MNTFLNTIAHGFTQTCSTLLAFIHVTTNQIGQHLNKCTDRCFDRTKNLFHNQTDKHIIYITWGSMVYPFPWRERFQDFVRDMCQTFPAIKEEYIDYVIVRDNNFEQLHVGSQTQYEALVPLIDVNRERNIYTHHIFVSYVVLRKTARRYVKQLK